VFGNSEANSDGDVTTEIKARLGAAGKCYFGLMKHLSSKLLSRKVKWLVYNTSIRPVLIFGLWVNKARIFLGPLTGNFYGKCLAWCLKIDVAGDARTVQCISSMMNMAL
jgi:hypothetical protein